MRRIITIIIFMLLAVPAAAQHQGIQWQQDLEAAKAAARQAGKFVLVHFWTESCGPCVNLDHQVFNQPGVAAAIDAQFVPVKLNANENPATAQGFGISRVPTDVIITPEGEVVGKLISPPTPAAYVGEVTQVANAHRSKAGAAFAQSATQAPVPAQINAAYAKLAVPPTAQPAAETSAGIARNAATSNPPSVSGSVAQSAPTAAIASPSATENHYAASPADRYAQMPASSASTSAAIPPVTTPSVAVPLVGAPPAHSMANPHVAATPVVPPVVAAAPPLSQPVPSQVAPFSSQVAPPTPAVQPAQPPVAATPQAGATNVTSASPTEKQLPAGAPPLGFEGYCPVSMRNEWKWVPGDPKWGIVHRGRTYWFAGQEEQQQFWSDPDRYSPALSGMDPVMAVDHQQQVPGKREHSIDYDNLFYMFCSEATLQQFTANPERYAGSVRQVMGIQRGRLVR